MPFLGAWTILDGVETKLFGSKIWSSKIEDSESNVKVNLEGSNAPGVIHKDGLLIAGSDGVKVNVRLLSIDGKFVQVKRAFDQQRSNISSLNFNRHQSMDKIPDPMKLSV